MPKQSPLHASIVDGELRITVGIDTIAHAIRTSSWALAYNENLHDYTRDFAIIDNETVAKEVQRALEKENEIGDSLLTEIFDRAAQMAIDDGAEGILYDVPPMKLFDMHPLEKP